MANYDVREELDGTSGDLSCRRRGETEEGGG